MAKASDNKTDVAGLAMGACVLLGIGFGMLVGEVGAGTIIGVGVGLVAMAILRSKKA